VTVNFVTGRQMTLPPFWTLVQEHGTELMRHARRMAGDDHAEDVLQEAFLRALRSYPRVKDAGHLRAWLFRITTTTAFDHHARRREAPVGAVPDKGVEETYDDGAFDDLIETLAPASKEAVRLRFVDDLSYADMAGRLGCSEAAARQRVSGGIRELRRKMR
jgi:RNA polymerase sigma-70 factor (ECF subfamily)